MTTRAIRPAAVQAVHQPEREQVGNRDDYRCRPRLRPQQAERQRRRQRDEDEEDLRGRGGRTQDWVTGQRLQGYLDHGNERQHQAGHHRGVPIADGLQASRQADRTPPCALAITTVHSAHCRRCERLRRPLGWESGVPRTGDTGARCPSCR